MRSMGDTFWLLEVVDCLNIHVHIEWSLEVEDGPMCGRLDQTDHNRCILLAREDGVTDFKDIQMIHAGVKLMIRYSLCLSVSFWSEYWLGLVVLLEEEASISLDCSAAILGCHAYNWFWE
jgi:hypothetical protein